MFKIMNNKTTLNGNHQTLLIEAIEALSACMTMQNKTEAQAKFISTLDQVHNLQEAHAKRTLGLATSSSSAPSFGLIGKLARQVLNHLSTPSHRKKYGQFFTPPTISALACAAAIHTEDTSIIDPMCGTGSMLWAAHDRLTHLGGKENLHITGIERDALTARIAVLPPSENYDHDLLRLNVLCADAFLELSGLSSNHPSINHYGHYSAIVGNPPYIRYQNFSALLKESCPILVDAFRKQLPNEPDTAVANTIIRASLIAPLLLDTLDNPQEMAKKAIDLLRLRQSVPFLNPAEACWLKMVASYSGLADLSVPAWLLTWLLARPGATIAYVTTGSWRNREYARLLRYFMLRMLKPLYIIEEEGNSWFGNALVQTSLMVFRARPSEEAAIPLQERKDHDHQVRFVRFHREHNLANPSIFRQVAWHLNPHLAANSSGHLAAYADTIIKAISARDQDEKNNLWTMNLISERVLADSLLTEDNTAQRAGAGGIRLQVLEGQDSGPRSARRPKVTDSRQNALPLPIKQILGITHSPAEAFRLLTDYGVTVNQGLRTGCNPFFYFSRLMADESQSMFATEELFDAVSILEKPKSAPSRFAEILNYLQSEGALVSKELASSAASASLVQLASEFKNRLAVFPNAYLEPVIRYQRTLTHWGITDSVSLPDLALVTRGGVHPNDYAELAMYPDDWIQIWEKRDNLSLLSPSLAKYISLGARTVLKRNGKSILIPKLSAVAPNQRTPTVHVNDVSLFKDEVFVPRVPAWWYTLPILPRHLGHVFMPRVNHHFASAYLNSLSNPVLIDANFTTFTVQGDPFPPEALFALLNSIWVKTILELIATPMGGGALKVEAAHLRLLPVPHINHECIGQLANLGRNLARSRKQDQNVPRMLEQIDLIVINKLATIFGVDANRISDALDAASTDLRAQRQRSD